MFNRIREIFRLIIGSPNESAEEGQELVDKHSKSKNKSLKSEPENELTIPRQVLIRLEPELIQKAEAITPDAGIEQLQDDVRRGFIKFKGVLPPKKFGNLSITEFHKEMKVFLLDLNFSEANIDRIFKHYTSNPAQAIHLGHKLIALKHTQQSNSDEGMIYQPPKKISKKLPPKKISNNIYEEKDKVFFEAKARKYPANSDSGNIVTNNDELSSLFELQNKGFKLINYKTINSFSDLMNILLRKISLDERNEPGNERIVPRHVLAHLEPEIVKEAEVIPETTGIVQLQNDVGTGSINFNGVLPPGKFGNLRSIAKFDKRMKEFLLDLNFSEANIDRIFKHYSQKPSYAVGKFAETLLELKYNKETYPNDGELKCLQPRESIINIFEKNGDVFFGTIASKFPITCTNKKIGTVKEIDIINDQLESLFKLKDDGFKLEHFKTFDLFSILTNRFLNSISLNERKESFHKKREVNDWIFTYCMAANSNSKVDHLSRQNIMDENFKYIVNALSDPVLYRKVANALYENGLYFAKKYEFGGGKHCGFQQLITNLSNHYKKQFNEVLMQFNNDFIKTYRNKLYVSGKSDDYTFLAIVKLKALKLYPDDINAVFNNGEVIRLVPKVPKDQRKHFSQSTLNLLDHLHDLSSKMVYLKKIRIKRKSASSNLMFKESNSPSKYFSLLLEEDKKLGIPALKRP